MKPYNTDQTKKEEVREMFDNIAPRYDLLNHTLSVNIDRIWRRRAVNEVRRANPRRILDVATGTGDLAIALARRIRDVQVMGVDLSEEMLAVARRKVEARVRELARTIKPGGKVVILEFSRPRNRVFRALYEFYSYKILPRIGGLVSRDKRAYEYLPASVGEFPAPAEFLGMMEKAGFRNCRAKSQSCGIAQIYIGER